MIFFATILDQNFTQLSVDVRPLVDFNSMS